MNCLLCWKSFFRDFHGIGRESVRYRLETESNIRFQQYQFPVLRNYLLHCMSVILTGFRFCFHNLS